MRAFISYSHKDAAMLDRLHAHLSQLKRDGKLVSWTDEVIQAGGRIGQHISHSLETAQIFLALLSPDYLASNYCYEQEFLRAQELEKDGSLIIVPIILEPCDWQNTPFTAFKALPKDGKPISDWSNINTAFLDVTQNLRKLLEQSPNENQFISGKRTTSQDISPSRNYRVKKDFDSIQKMEFVEKAFDEIKEKLEAYLKEVIQVDEHIKYRIAPASAHRFEAILVNRNKANAECTLTLVNDSELKGGNSAQRYTFQIGKYDLTYTLSAGQSGTHGFTMAFDEYHLYWTEGNTYHRGDQKEIGTKEMADSIWNAWLESVGIM